MPHMMRRQGSVLITTVVLVAILTIIALALISRNTDQIEATSSKRRYDVSAACADGARQLLMSQFNAYSKLPTAITLDSTVNDKLYTTGHYNSFAVQSVQIATGGQTSQVGVSDVVNRTSGVHLGGSLYRMTVVCTDTNSSRQDEVEFLVRFGF